MEATVLGPVAIAQGAIVLRLEILKGQRHCPAKLADQVAAVAIAQVSAVEVIDLAEVIDRESAAELIVPVVAIVPASAVMETVLAIAPVSVAAEIDLAEIDPSLGEATGPVSETTTSISVTLTLETRSTRAIESPLGISSAIDGPIALVGMSTPGFPGRVGE